MEKLLCCLLLLVGLTPGTVIGEQNFDLSLRHAIKERTDLPRSTYLMIIAAQSSLSEADLVMGLASSHPLVRSASAQKLAELPSLQPATVWKLADIAVSEERDEVALRVSAALLQIGLHQPELVAPLIEDVRPVRYRTRLAVSDIAVAALKQAGYTDVTRLLALQARAPSNTANDDYLEAGSSQYYAFAIAALLQDRPVDFSTFQSIASASDESVRHTAYDIASNVEGHSSQVVSIMLGLMASDKTFYYDRSPADELMSVGPMGKAAVKNLLFSSSEVTRRRAAQAYFRSYDCADGGLDLLLSLAPDALSTAVSEMTKAARAESYACLAPLVTSDLLDHRSKLNLISRLARYNFRDHTLPESVRSVWKSILTDLDHPLRLSLATSVGSDSGLYIPIEELRRRLLSSRQERGGKRSKPAETSPECHLIKLLAEHPSVSREDAEFLLDRLNDEVRFNQTHCLRHHIYTLHEKNPSFPAPPRELPSALTGVDNIDALLNNAITTGEAVVPRPESTVRFVEILKNEPRSFGKQSNDDIERSARLATMLLLSYPDGELHLLATLEESRDPLIRKVIFEALAHNDRQLTQREAFIQVALRSVSESSDGVEDWALDALAVLQSKPEFIALAKQLAGAASSARVRSDTFYSLRNWGYFNSGVIRANLADMMALVELFEAASPDHALELLIELGASAPTDWRRERMRKGIALGSDSKGEYDDPLSKAIDVHWDVASGLLAEAIDAGLSLDEIVYALRQVDKKDQVVFAALLRRYQQDPSVPEIASLLVEFQLEDEEIPEVRARITDERPDVARIATSMMLPRFVLDASLECVEVGAAKDYASTLFVARRLDSVLEDIRPWIGPVSISHSLPLSSLPEFPWPPPPWSFKETLSASLIGEDSTIGHAHDRIVVALRNVSPDFDHGLFSVPDGILVLARMERIRRDGTPLDGGKRWSSGFIRPETLEEYFEELLFSPPGYFRIIAIVISATEPIESNDDAQLPSTSGGSKQLPEHLRVLPMRGMMTTALIYTFERSSSGSFSRGYTGSPAGLTHLQRAGLLNALFSNR